MFRVGLVNRSHIENIGFRSEHVRSRQIDKPLVGIKSDSPIETEFRRHLQMKIPGSREITFPVELPNNKFVTGNSFRNFNSLIRDTRITKQARIDEGQHTLKGVLDKMLSVVTLGCTNNLHLILSSNIVLP